MADQSNDNPGAEPNEAGGGKKRRKQRATLKSDVLEPRILLSATWVDADTGDAQADATEGNDVGTGDGADDTLYGLGGDDQLFGGGGNDSLFGGEGNDLLSGGTGDDTLDGGAGQDTLDLSDATAGVSVDITLDGQAQDLGSLGTDTLDSIEGVVGSGHDDTFAFTQAEDGAAYTVAGGDGENTIDLSGYNSDDVIVGSDRIVVETGGESFTIDYTGVDEVTFADGTASTPEPDVIDDHDPTHRWHFTDGEAVDMAGDSAGTIGGDPVGDGEGSATFDGTDHYVLEHTDDMLQDEGTIHLRFNADTVSGTQGLFSKDSDYFDDGGHVTMWVKNGEVEVRVQSTSASYTLRSDVGVQAGAWHDVSLSFGSDGLNLYVDGELADTDSYTGGLGASSGGSGNTEPIVIGANAWSSSDGSADKLKEFFSGKIQDVAIFGDQIDGASLYQDPALEGTGGDDVFDLTAAVAGDAFSLDGGAGNDTIDLSSFDSEDVTFSNGRLTVETGSGSFTVDYANVETIRFADADALVVDGDLNDLSISGETILVDGDVAVSVDPGGGTLELDYDADANTLDVTASGGGHPITIDSLGATDVTVGTLDVRGDTGGITSDVDIDTMTVDEKADLGTVDVGGGSGTIGTITFDAGKNVNAGPAVINANVGTINAQEFQTDVTINGDLGLLNVVDDLTSDSTFTVNGDAKAVNIGDAIWNDADLVITGSAGDVNIGGLIAANSSVDLGGASSLSSGNVIGNVTIGSSVGAVTTGTISGTFSVTGDIASLTLSGSGADISGSVVVSGNLGDVTVPDDMIGALSVGGDLGSFSLGSNFNASGSLEVDGGAGQISIDGNMNGSLAITGAAGDVKIGGPIGSSSTVELGGATAFNSGTVAGDVSIGSSVGAVTTGTISGSFSVTGDIASLTLTGSGADISGLVAVSGNLGDVTVPDDMSGSLAVGGNLGSFALGDNLNGSASLTVGGDAGSIAIDGKLSGDVSVGGDAGGVSVGETLSGATLNVTGAAGDLSIGSTIDGSSVISLGGATSFSSGSVAGAVTIGSSVGAVSTGTISGTIDVTGDVASLTLNGSGSDISGAVNVTGALGDVSVPDDVTGALTVGGNLASISVGDNFNGTASLNVGGDAGPMTFTDNMHGAVSVGGNAGGVSIGATVTGGTLQVVGDAGDISIGGSINAASTINVGGATSFNSVGMAGDLTVGSSLSSLTTGHLTGTVLIDGDVGSMTVQGSGSDLGGTVEIRGDVGPIDVGDDFAGDLTVTGSLTSLTVNDNMTAAASLDVAGSVGTVDVGDRIVKGGTIKVTGDLDSVSAAVGIENGSSITAGVATGAITITDGATVHNEAIPGDAEIIYDGSTLTVNHDNDAPTDLDFDGTTVAENAPAGTVVGTASATDPDSGETFTFELTDDADGQFEIDPATGVVTVADGADLNHEGAGSHTLSVKVTDIVGNERVESFDVAVSDVNEEIESLQFITTDGSLIGEPEPMSYGFESDAVGSPLTSLDFGDGVTASVTQVGGQQNAIIEHADGYGAVAGEGDRFWKIAGGETSLGFSQPLTEISFQVSDVEWGDVTVSAGGVEIPLPTGNSGGTDVVTITAPEGETFDTITFTWNSPSGQNDGVGIDGIVVTPAASETTAAVAENSAAGTVVATAAAGDPDAGEAFTYELTDDADGRFEIDPSTGVVTVAAGADLNYEDVDSHTLSVKVTDSAGHEFEEALVVEVTDVVEWAVDAGDDVAVNEGGRVTLSAGVHSSGGGGSLDFESTTIESHGGSSQDKGVDMVVDGDALSMTGNGWKSVDYPVTITEDTILEFQFRSDAEGEIHGIGFDTDGGLSENRMFKLGGTQDWGIDTHDNYAGDGEWVTYRIRVGDHFTGDFDRLVFANDHDVSGANANSQFRGIQVYEEGEDVPTDGVVYHWEQVSGPPVVLDDPTAAELSFDAPSVADDSELVFKVTATHGDTVVTDEVVVQVNDITDLWSVDAGSDLSVEEGDSVTLGASVGTVETLDFGGVDIESHGGSSQDKGVDMVVDGDALSMTGNGWKSVDYPVTITEDTILEFQFRSDAEGEIHGIGFDTDGGLSENRMFKLGGTQDWGIDTHDNYAGDGEWVTYRIRVGDHFTGDFDRLVFANDHDVTGADANSQFRGVKVYDPSAETPVEGVTYQWEQISGPPVVLDDASAAAPKFDTPYITSDAEVVFRVTATVGDNVTTDEVTVQIANDNEAPTDLHFNPGEVAEGAAAGTEVGVVGVVDPDNPETHVYELVDDAGGRFAVNANTGLVTVADGAALDYESSADHSISVKVTDSVGNERIETFVIEVANVNEAITDMSFSGGTVAENAVAGTVVGTAAATDTDHDATHTFALTDDAKGKFVIDPQTGVVTVAEGAVLDFEQAKDYPITILVTDEGGLTREQSFEINLIDVPDELDPAELERPARVSEEPSYEPADRAAEAGIGAIDRVEELVAEELEFSGAAGGEFVPVAELPDLAFEESLDWESTEFGEVLPVRELDAPAGEPDDLSYEYALPLSASDSAATSGAEAAHVTAATAGSGLLAKLWGFARAYRGTSPTTSVRQEKR